MRGLTPHLRRLAHHRDGLAEGRGRGASPLEETRLPAAPTGETLELDERWSFVITKRYACWIWLALCRHTRQVTGGRLRFRRPQRATNHVERWNLTLSQRLGRFVRKTLSVSQREEMHEICLRLFLHRCNRDRFYALSTNSHGATTW